MTDANVDRTLLDFSLSRITFLSVAEKEILYNKLDSSRSLALLSLVEISELVNRKIAKAVWNGQENLRLAEREMKLCEKLGVVFLKYDNPEYPALVREILNPPYMLFFRGNMEALKQKSVSVVGTRRTTPHGKAAAIQFAHDAASDGVCVVSGLANGIDGFSHKGAVDTWLEWSEAKKDVSLLGRTIAVLPSSIDSILPVNHTALARKILESGGLLVSEYAPLTDMAKWHYVKRNRIIAALSPATVVVEAPNGSGALITADFALELGRDVMIHTAALGEQARKVEKLVKAELTARYNKKEITAHKLESCVDSFIEDGAPVIANYEDYVKCRAEMPGSRAYVNIQPELIVNNE